MRLFPEPTTSSFAPWKRRLSPLFLALGALGAFAAACDEEHAVVRERPDGGGASVDAATDGVLGCGAVVPTVYVSPAFATNASQELDLRSRAFEIDHKMQVTEGASTAILTSAELAAAFTAGAPSLRSVATPSTQALVDGYLSDYGDAVGRIWSPQAAAADGGAAAGGKYEGAFHVSAAGLDLRTVTARTLLGGAFYEHAAALVTAPVSEATVDRLLAAFGASTALADRVDDDAGADRDALSAELAAERDDGASPTKGLYGQARAALFTLKASATRPDACNAEWQAALATFFDVWERTLLASTISALNDAALFATAVPPKGPATLRAVGGAIGLVQGMRGVSWAHRTITDDQVTTLLGTIGADDPALWLTNGTERATSATAAIQAIAKIYGFSQSEVEAFKR